MGSPLVDEMLEWIDRQIAAAETDEKAHGQTERTRGYHNRELLKKVRLRFNEIFVTEEPW